MATVDCFMLCDGVQVANGKLFILGGGWSRLTTSTLPVQRSLELAVRVVVPWLETNRPISFKLHLEDEDGRALLPEPVTAEVRVGRPATLADGSDQSVPFVLRIGNANLARSGRYILSLRQGEETVARTTFDLVVTEPGKRVQS